MKTSQPSDPNQAERMLDAMRGAGLKLTPQRIAIIRALAGDPSHPTAQELYDRLRPELPTMSFATVYNTLSSLAAQGLCASRALHPAREPSTGGGTSRGSNRFDPNMHPHDHAVCDRCGKVMDVARTGSGAKGGVQVVVTGFEVRAVERIYRGYCQDCRSD